MKHKPLVENAMIEPVSDNVHIRYLLLKHLCAHKCFKSKYLARQRYFLYISFIFFIRKHSLLECLPVIVLSYETTDM